MTETKNYDPSQIATEPTFSLRDDLSINSETGERAPDLEILDGLISERTEEALAGGEFQETPSLREALHGYFHDHYYLAESIRAIVEERYDSEIFDTIISSDQIQDWEKGIGSRFPKSTDDRERSSPNATTAAYRLAIMARNMDDASQGASEEDREEKHFNALRQCGVALQESLFLESSVGASTIGEQEIDLAASLADQVKEASGGRPIWSVPAGTRNFSKGQTVAENIKAVRNSFWSDTRYAGQLEFHGTGDLGGLNIHGLMSRNQQVREVGHMRVQTMLNRGDTMHSVVPHFSEFYGRGGYTMGGEYGGTVAVPLAKIIDAAPFARDGEYTMLQPKTGAADLKDKVPMPTVSRPTGDVGAGGSDRIGSTGKDRVFFSSPDETDKLPDDYKVDLFDKGNKPATYIVDRTVPDHGQKRELQDLGVGYGFPERLIIGEGDDRDAAIRSLQQDYFEAYNYRGVVVPLRRGVFAQSFENHDVTEARGRDAAQIYNRYTHGSEIHAV